MTQLNAPAEVSQAPRIGAYRMLRELGHGCMNRVYLAARADDELEKHVAIKVARSGLYNENAAQRFENETSVLASLKHPNIARLLDAGTMDNGRPFIVLEFVEGDPIDAYCDRHRFTTTQRLKLFRTVCEAVQYVHQNLVIHRDIKPDNILVTPDGVPKLLDFGVAKLLNADGTPNRATAMTALTPGYASPEQLQGGPLTIASDVFSLGVVMYKLLTGRSPYPSMGQSPAETERIVCTQNPPRPSVVVTRPTPGGHPTRRDIAAHHAADPRQLRRRLAGDLDNIILMALRKEAQGRYPSAAALSEDIQQHLDGHPVAAYRDTALYRLIKLVGLN